MRFQLSILTIVACLAQAWAGTLPPFIKPCSASDPNLNQCIENVISVAGEKFASGIPELGIASLDPVQLGTINIDSNSLKLTFTDTVVSGLQGFKVNSFKINPEKGNAAIDFTANVTLKAHYDMNGQILILPIRGNGNAKIKITNLNIVVKYNYETQNGHWVVTGYKDSYKMDHAQFKFSNLFGGNKVLANTIEAVINEHWEPVIRDIGDSTFRHIIAACVNESKKLFAAVPANELLLQ